MRSMFNGCWSLQKLNLTNFNTNNVINMKDMFCECSSLKEIPDISKWNTNNVEDMSGIFCNCSSLKKFKI